jgi:hypothetical protein
MGLMGPFQATDVVVVSAEHVCSAREELEILGAERRGPIRGGQRLERLAPSARSVGLATSLQLGDRIHWRDYRVLTLPPVDSRSLARTRLIRATRHQSAALPNGAGASARMSRLPQGTTTGPVGSAESSSHRFIASINNGAPVRHEFRRLKGPPRRLRDCRDGRHASLSRPGAPICWTDLVLVPSGRLRQSSGDARFA